MTNLKTLCFILLLFVFKPAKATTWDEPWQKDIIKNADYFVLAKIINQDRTKGITIQILKKLGGAEISGTIKITNFNLLHLCSRSGNEEPEFNLPQTDSCYFFIKKNDKNEYCIATPTSGFATVRGGNVAATYRHSYHQAFVEIGVYENTMTAIFNNAHGVSYDSDYINNFITRYLSIKPAGLDKNELQTFFNQHVALECIYHLGLKQYIDRIIPFFDANTNFHAQVSAARALVVHNNANINNKLLNKVKDGNANDFLKVMCIWTLAAHKPKELKNELQALAKTASGEENGFGGNFMDPRVCTNVPSVKVALEELLKTI